MAEARQEPSGNELLEPLGLAHPSRSSYVCLRVPISLIII